MVTVLLTGVTGNVGLEILRKLLPRAPEARVRLLIRARDFSELSERWSRTLALASGGRLRPADLPGFSPVRGDVARPDFGLAAPDLAAIRAETTHILHSAGATSFAASEASLAAPNVAGIEHLVALARRCERLRAVAHLSTCFVAGTRQGTIYEHELDHDHEFVNRYERSKYEGERIARAAMTELPLSVYRLSLLVGRRDGYVHKPGAFHYFLEQLWAGLLPMIPGNPQARFDLLPTDYAVEVLDALVFECWEPGRTYHVAAGEAASETLAWLSQTTDLYQQRSAAWRSGAHVPPDIVDIETYASLVDTVHTVGNATLARMLSVIDSLAEYPLSTKVFDRTNVDRALGGRLPAPPLASWYPAIIDRAITTRWYRAGER
jgi:thioester reductase-like protein